MYLLSQVKKLPCTSPYQSRNLSTETTSWDVSFSFSNNVFLFSVLTQTPALPAHFSAWGKLDADEVLCQTLWLATKSDCSNYCMSHSVDRDWGWLIANIIAGTFIVFYVLCDFSLLPLCLNSRGKKTHVYSNIIRMFCFKQIVREQFFFLEPKKIWYFTTQNCTLLDGNKQCWYLWHSRW